MVVRSLAGQATFALFFQSVTLLPIVSVTTIFQVNPFWITILACLLLGERIRLIDILGILTCFGGVVMIAMSKANQIEQEEQK